MRSVYTRGRFDVFSPVLLLLAVTGFAKAAPVYTGGSGAISFGVTDYGNPQNNGAATYIANNVTSLNDILSSPGGGSLGAYQTANPTLANNLASYAGALPGGGIQVGGSNGNGNFGIAYGSSSGTAMGYAISDSAPGGGSASYLINSEVATFTDAAGTNAGTQYGAWLTMGGNVSLLNSADVVSLKVHVSSVTAGSPFLGGVDLPEMVLAIARVATNGNINDYNIVKKGGATGLSAGLIVDDLANGTFRALAVDNQALGAAIPAGDVLTVSATLTAYADPADLSSFDSSPALDLLALTDPIPTDSFVGSQPAPEPASASLILLALGGLCLSRWR